LALARDGERASEFDLSLALTLRREERIADNTSPLPGGVTAWTHGRASLRYFNANGRRCGAIGGLLTPAGLFHIEATARQNDPAATLRHRSWL
jgi:hypothetical protein